MKRTPLALRPLPNYTKAEEITNTVTHIAGGVMGIAVLILCTVVASIRGDGWAIAASVIYGTSMVALYTVSSVYHGLTPGMAKKVMQVVYHCTIYFLIAGTYTMLLLTAIRPLYPAIAWGVFGFEWIMAVIATTLTAIDLKKYNVFSMICYIGMGWAIILFARQTLQAMTMPGFLLLLSGGIAYTIGAVLYGIGSRRKWMHSVFHVFVVLGSVLQFLAVIFYAL